MVPTLIEAIKVAGLVLVSDTESGGETAEVPSQHIGGPRTVDVPKGIDGVLAGTGVLRFNETIDM
jgi:CDK inhibitor PHO81